MLVSLCIPCHKRLDDLRLTMPYLVNAANAAAPVEIAVVIYGWDEDTNVYLDSVRKSFTGGSFLNVKTYTGRDHYHMSHARNLSVMISQGEIIVILSADIYVDPRYVQLVRETIGKDPKAWVHAHRYRGVIAIRREEFIAAGGYDERFEFYGPEDRDLNERLIRRLGGHTHIPSDLIHVFRTPDTKKVENYRLALSKAEMSRRMRPIFEENEANQILVANQGKEWGRW